jgi:hypothetical protein
MGGRILRACSPLFSHCHPLFNLRNKTMSREYTCKLLEMVEHGLLDRDNVIMACVKYMSEDEVRDMMHANEFTSEEGEEETEGEEE